MTEQPYSSAQELTSKRRELGRRPVALVKAPEVDKDAKVRVEALRGALRQVPLEDGRQLLEERAARVGVLGALPAVGQHQHARIVGILRGDIDPDSLDQPPPPSGAAGAGGAVAAQEFRRVCTTENLRTCVPECNAVTYGYLLSIEIDGKGTVMTCNKMEGRFSWVGQASLGGFIGVIFAAFFSSVISGAAGTYMVTLAEDPGVSTDLAIRAGQSVVVSGDERLAAACSAGRAARAGCHQLMAWAG